MSRILNRKVDVSAIDSLHEIKADKEDIDQTRDLIDSLNNRVKHLSVIFHEMAGALMPVRNSISVFDDEAKKKLFVKIKNVQKQSNIVTHWINDVNLEDRL